MRTNYFTITNEYKSEKLTNSELQKSLGCSCLIRKERLYIYTNKLKLTLKRKKKNIYISIN